MFIYTKQHYKVVVFLSNITNSHSLALAFVLIRFHCEPRSTDWLTECNVHLIIILALTALKRWNNKQKKVLSSGTSAVLLRLIVHDKLTKASDELHKKNHRRHLLSWMPSIRHSKAQRASPMSRRNSQIIVYAEKPPEHQLIKWYSRRLRRYNARAEFFFSGAC